MKASRVPLGVAHLEDDGCRERVHPQPLPCASSRDCRGASLPTDL